MSYPPTDQEFSTARAEAETLYKHRANIPCPYFGSGEVTLNSDGFNHLLFKPNRAARNRSVSMLKFSLLPLALKVIKKSGTLQEYRTAFIPVGSPSAHGAQSMRAVQYFGFCAIIGEDHRTRIKVILRQVGAGHVHFWSVMPNAKPGKNGDRPTLMKHGTEEE